MSIRAKHKIRMVIRRQSKHSVSIHKTAKHIYVRLVDPNGVTLTHMSTLSPALRKVCPNGSNKEAAKKLGIAFAGVLKKLKITDFAVDRSGFPYHGRLACVVDGLREKGIMV